MAVNLNFNDVVSNAAQLYITGVANGTIGLPTLVASGAILASAGTSTPPTWANELNLFSGTKTASTPILNLTQTWNNAGVVFTGLKLNVTSTASAVGSLLIDLQVAGSSRFSIDKAGGLVTSSDAYFSGDLKGILNTSKLTLGVSSDVILARDAANTLALRNGPAAQEFNVYNTHTDASNYERGYSRWNAGVFEFGMEAAGTGWAKHTRIHRASGANLYLGDWSNDSSGHFLASVDNTYDIGAYWSNRPRNIYAGTDIYVGNGYAIKSPTKGSYSFGGGDGVHTLFNNARTDFGRLQFGGTTNAFPALKRNGSQLIVRLADDSGNASLQASFLDASAYVSAGTYVKTQSVTVASLTSAATAGAGARSFVTDATATTFMSVVAGGGANKVPVVSDGTNWLIG